MKGEKLESAEIITYKMIQRKKGENWGKQTGCLQMTLGDSKCGRICMRVIHVPARLVAMPTKTCHGRLHESKGQLGSDQSHCHRERLTILLRLDACNAAKESGGCLPLATSRTEHHGDEGSVLNVENATLITPPFLLFVLSVAASDRWFPI